MKVVIINTFEIRGGAAVAANRLMQALINAGIETKMLVRDKQTENRSVEAINISWFGRRLNFFRFVWERLIIFLNNKRDRKSVFQVSIANTGTDISNHPFVNEADVIHLHWINQGFLSLKDIKRLKKLGKPIVWTMHDMWPFTGICHHARECVNYKTECGMCPFLDSAEKIDISTHVFNQKKQLFFDDFVSFVGCSDWISSLAKQSKLTCTSQIESIPNTLDLSIYNLQNKKKAKDTFGLTLSKKYILFGAVNINDYRKGFDFFVESIEYLKINNPDLFYQLEVITFGEINMEALNKLPIKVTSLGYMTDERLIAKLYNAVDVYVTPSLEENLPNTIMESMACGTPCVGFDIGGIPEMIDHMQNGYVAKYKNADDLSNGIEWVLNTPDVSILQDACLKKVDSCYSNRVVTTKYISLYNKLLST